MIWVDFENRLPTDTNIPGWTPWTPEQWQEWLDKSAQLTAELAYCVEHHDFDARNLLIEASSNHWGKLKPWLEVLSHKKCWFSEAKELYSDYHVEHFRPKKAAKSIAGQTRDGYWWLAFDYRNFRLCGSVGNTKKGDWFPLRNDVPCCTYGGSDVDTEEPFFIDPTRKQDVKLIAFDDTGEIKLAPGRSDAWEARRVEVTSLRLKLFEHENLAEERRKVWQRIVELAGRYQETISNYDVAMDGAARDRISDVFKDIRGLVHRETQLCSVACWSLYQQNIKPLEMLIPQDWRDIFLGA